ncbi:MULTISPECIES: hypothetical protein [Sphingobium]|uniref:Uncharacterized protein n=1 Tax=Sphingobium baderi TaxID=1332080 RepID=A0A0S3EWA4_9SPHN|nr:MULTISPECIES: hypothetical protein [Sphingobium]ALR19700.1 hypothetical protein ATN00_04635 [Sphingobium baderi]
MKHLVLGGGGDRRFGSSPFGQHKMLRGKFQRDYHHLPHVKGQPFAKHAAWVVGFSVHFD